MKFAASENSSLANYHIVIMKTSWGRAVPSSGQARARAKFVIEN
jgi:hypothetical protein